MIEINLLPPQNQRSRREALLRNKMLLLAAGVTLILALDLGLFLPMEAVWKREVAGLVARREELLTGLETVSSLALDLRTVEEKAVGVEAIQNLRADLATMVIGVRDLAGDDIELANFSVDASGGVAFGAKAGRVAALSQLIARITSPDTKFSGVVLKGLGQSAGGYNFQVEAKYDNQR